MRAGRAGFGLGVGALIVLDTHVWVNWVADNPSLSKRHRQIIVDGGADGIGVSIISCWEVAMLASLGRLRLSLAVGTWIEQALRYPRVRLLELTPTIVVDSTQLPGEFHRDPADRLLVATARALKCAILTHDERIVSYPHVQAIGPTAKT